MAERFLIEGGQKLEGEIEIMGSKNASGQLLAATILTDEECLIDNLPKVNDVFVMLDILKNLGKEVDWVNERKVKIKGGDIDPAKLDIKEISKARMSVLLIGALLPRVSEFRISRPGGDRIGLRPITTHLKAIEELGVEIGEEGDFYYFKAKKLEGKEIVLSEFSVTATANLIMTASLTNGITVVKGAACEPEIVNLAEMLNKMGARIEGVGTHTIKIEGVKKLNGGNFSIIPDRIEIGTFLVIGALNKGKVILKNIRPDHLDLFLAKLKEIGVNFKIEKDYLLVEPNPNLKAVRVQALPYPGFATDFLPLVVPLLTQAEGRSLIHDPLYENRLNYTSELRKMGADIEIVDPHRAFIFGKTMLQGVSIESWDIRAGASLLIAGLIAKGKTTISNIYQIDRGYEKIDERLQKLGAKITRIKN